MSLCCQLSPQDIDYVNRQIQFSNETIHGLLVAHRIYEGYNQSINKYVDLPSYQVNRYSNQDLPDDIFEDPERWFYDEPPNTIYRSLDGQRPNSALPDKLWAQVIKLHAISEHLNNHRITLATVIQSNQIQQVEGVQTIYKGLEDAIDRYDLARGSIKSMERSLLDHYLSIELQPAQRQIYTALIEIHYDVKKSLRNIRSDNQSGVVQTTTKLNREIEWLSACINEIEDARQVVELLRIRDLISDLVADLNTYLNGSHLPEEYAVFGKGYYYHNVELLTQMNRYGNGYISETNTFFDSFEWPVIHFLEEPHFLRLVSPSRVDLETILSEEIDPLADIKTIANPINLPDLSQVVVTTDQRINNDPNTEQSIIEVASPTPSIIKASHSIFVDSLSFELELYDHKRKDGDRVSINVNGEWLFRDISLEKKPQRLKLSIQPNVDNFIMIKAENIGWQPPNTVGIRYRSKSGRVTDVFLKTDLDRSEVVEIKYRQG